ncbi:hypothetical protein P8452_77615 [Trifolium repens]|nr:hypothetical protein P8452_77615 [Trifolium repens]
MNNHQPIEIPNSQITEKHRATLLEFGKIADGKITTAMALWQRGVSRLIIPEIYTPELDIIQAYDIKLIEKKD